MAVWSVCGRRVTVSTMEDKKEFPRWFSAFRAPDHCVPDRYDIYTCITGRMNDTTSELTVHLKQVSQYPLHSVPCPP